MPRNALTGADIRGLTGRDVRNNTLTGRDVKRCTPVASSGWANSGGSEFVDRSAVASTLPPDRVDEVKVVMFGDEGSPGLANVSFNLAVFC